MSDRSPKQLARQVKRAFGRPMTTYRGADPVIDAGYDALDELQALAEAGQRLDDAIRDMLDFAAGFCSEPANLERRLGAIEQIGNAALAAAAPPPADQRTPTYAEEQLAEIERREPSP